MCRAPNATKQTSDENEDGTWYENEDGTWSQKSDDVLAVRQASQPHGASIQCFIPETASKKRPFDSLTGPSEANPQTGSVPEERTSCKKSEDALVWGTLSQQMYTKSSTSPAIDAHRQNLIRSAKDKDCTLWILNEACPATFNTQVIEFFEEVVRNPPEIYKKQRWSNGHLQAVSLSSFVQDLFFKIHP